MENKNKAPSLHELQLWMRWIVTDPRGVREALADPFPQARPFLERYTSPQKTALPWIAETPPIGKEERLDIYAEAYFARVLESMKTDFSITARVLGEHSFQKLVSDYLKEFPSRSTNIGEVGRSFSKFISKYTDLKDYPFLEPLAKMEWTLIESFHAENSGTLNPSKLSKLSNENWENIIFKLAPSTKLVRSQWPLDQFWRLLDESISLQDQTFTPSISRNGFIFIRENGAVSLETLTAPEYFILAQLNSGANLVTSLEKAQDSLPHQDFGAEVMNWFNQWVRRGIICDLKLTKEEAIK